MRMRQGTTVSVPAPPDDERCREEAACSSIEKSSTWWENQKAERDLANRASERYSFLRGYHRAQCDICLINIGPAQVERALYFWPVKGIGLYMADDEKMDEDGNVIPPPVRHGLFYVCGGCAAGHNLPESLRVIAPSDWRAHLAHLTTVEFDFWLRQRYQEAKSAAFPEEGEDTPPEKTIPVGSPVSTQHAFALPSSFPLDQAFSAIQSLRATFCEERVDAACSHP